MAITTNDCKKAIVNWIKLNPGYVSKQFIPPEQEIDAQKEKNWKRMSKRKCKYGQQRGLIERAFNCVPYDDQLRAYTYDDDNSILKVIIQGQ